VNVFSGTGLPVKQLCVCVCACIGKEGHIPEDWQSSIVLPIYKGKGDPMDYGSYRGIKLLEHAMKVVERIFEYRLYGVWIYEGERNQ